MCPKPVEPTKKLQAASIADSQMVFGPQAQRLIPIIHNGMCDTEALSAGLVIMKPLKVARPHIHRHCESILYFSEGWFATLVGEELEPIFHGPGDLMYVPQDVIHVGINLSAESQAVALEIRTDPAFNEDVVVLDRLTDKVNQKAKELQQLFAEGKLPLPRDWKKRGFGPYRFTERAQDKKFYNLS
jgi:uncharacterized RmlC-like cupin family protein